MYTKTATAVVLALLGATNAGDIDLTGKTLTNDNLTEVAVKDRGCAGNVVLAVLGGAKELKDEQRVLPSPTNVNDALTCFTQAADQSVNHASRAGKTDGVCVSWTPAGTDPIANPAHCLVHSGYRQPEAKATDGTVAVYMRAGKYQDDAQVLIDDVGYLLDAQGDAILPVPHLAPNGQTTHGPVQRFCRCAGGKWTYKLDANKARIPRKNADGTNLVVNGLTQFEVVWGKCPAEPTHYVTNWMQLTKDADGNLNYPKTCPPNWEVPEDLAPADMGSFKGYTNRYSFSACADDDMSPTGQMVTFNNESPNQNKIEGSAAIGCIAGFAAFGIGIICVTIAIALDMRKRSQMYEEMIQGDLQTINQMGLGNKMKEMQVELAARLAGGAAETGVDDQLVTQALELRNEDFAKYM